MKRGVGSIQVFAFVQGAIALNDAIESFDIVYMHTDWQAQRRQAAIATAYLGLTMTLLAILYDIGHCEEMFRPDLR